MRGLAAQIPASAFDKEARIDYGFADEDGTWKVVSVGPTVIY